MHNIYATIKTVRYIPIVLKNHTMKERHSRDITILIGSTTSVCFGAFNQSAHKENTQ